MILTLIELAMDLIFEGFLWLLKKIYRLLKRKP